MLTLSCSRCMNSTSRGLSPCPEGAMKYRQQWTRLSGIWRLITLDSAFKNSSYLDSMYSITGFQLQKMFLLCISHISLFFVYFRDVKNLEGSPEQRDNYEKSLTRTSCCYNGVYTYQLLLSTASPKPGVSTIVSVRFTPFSFKSTLFVSTATVFFMRRLGPGCSAL